MRGEWGFQVNPRSRFPLPTRRRTIRPNLAHAWSDVQSGVRNLSIFRDDPDHLVRRGLRLGIAGRHYGAEASLCSSPDRRSRPSAAESGMATTARGFPDRGAFPVPYPGYQRTWEERTSPAAISRRLELGDLCERRSHGRLPTIRTEAKYSSVRDVVDFVGSTETSSGQLKCKSAVKARPWSGFPAPASYNSSRSPCTCIFLV
jgi:hypothetical protein